MPIIQPPPTPTLEASFIVIYSSTEDCGSSKYGIKFKITNNGSITWESNQVDMTDLTTTEHHIYSWNNFPNPADSGYAIISADLNLEAGEVGYTSSLAFTANPAGHTITATIRVCSQDGMAGTCLEKTLSFNP